jgi:two-component system chemotaxis sensor kinase CheA
MVHSLKLEPTQRRLEHFGEQVQRIAARLEKDVAVRVEAHDLRVDPRHWAAFWTAFIHAVRNAVDHGLETAEERKRSGKSEQAFIALRTCVRGDRFVIEVADDGRGIDWRRIAAKALAMGIPSTTEEQLRAAKNPIEPPLLPEVQQATGRSLFLERDSLRNRRWL